MSTVGRRVALMTGMIDRQGQGIPLADWIELLEQVSSETHVRLAAARDDVRRPTASASSRSNVPRKAPQLNPDALASLRALPAITLQDVTAIATEEGQPILDVLTSLQAGAAQLNYGEAVLSQLCAIKRRLLGLEEDNPAG